MRPEILILCFGNPGRGDDALGPLLFQHLERIPGKFDLVCGIQLQIEHVLDLEGRECIVFADAALDVRDPFEMRQISPSRDASHSTHALSPEALLDIYETVLKKPAPKAYLLGMKAESFGLGEPLSRHAERSLREALDFLLDFMGLKSGLGKTQFPG